MLSQNPRSATASFLFEILAGETATNQPRTTENKLHDEFSVNLQTAI